MEESGSVGPIIASFLLNLESNVRDPHARRAVVLLERGQLEDKHLRLMEENLVRPNPY